MDLHGVLGDEFLLTNAPLSLHPMELLLLINGISENTPVNYVFFFLLMGPHS